MQKLSQLGGARTYGLHLTDDQQAIITMAMDVVNAEIMPLARRFDESVRNNQKRLVLRHPQ